MTIFIVCCVIVCVIVLLAKVNSSDKKPVKNISTDKVATGILAIKHQYSSDNVFIKIDKDLLNSSFSDIVKNTITNKTCDKNQILDILAFLYSQMFVSCAKYLCEINNKSDVIDTENKLNKIFEITEITDDLGHKAFDLSIEFLKKYDSRLTNEFVKYLNAVVLSSIEKNEFLIKNKNPEAIINMTIDAIEVEKRDKAEGNPELAELRANFEMMAFGNSNFIKAIKEYEKFGREINSYEEDYVGIYKAFLKRFSKLTGTKMNNFTDIADYIDHFYGRR